MKPVLPSLAARLPGGTDRRATVIEALLRRDRARARLALSLDVAVQAINAGCSPGDAILALLACRDDAATVDWATCDVILALADELLAHGVDAAFVRRMVDDEPMH